MSKLTEHKTTTYHYYSDDQGRIQGEYKYWWENGRPRTHSLNKDGDLHGEYKYWNKNGELGGRAFFQYNKDITNQVKALVEDFNNITHKEKIIIKLTYGIDWIGEEIICRN